MTNAEREKLTEFAGAYQNDLAAQGVIVTEFDDSVLMEELRVRFFDYKAKVGISRDVLNGGNYIYGE